MDHLVGWLVGWSVDQHGAAGRRPGGGALPKQSRRGSGTVGTGSRCRSSGSTFCQPPAGVPPSLPLPPQSLLNAYFWLLGSIAMVGAFGPTLQTLVSGRRSSRGVQMRGGVGGMGASGGRQGGDAAQEGAAGGWLPSGGRRASHATTTLALPAAQTIIVTHLLPLCNPPVQGKSVQQPVWRFEVPAWLQAADERWETATQGDLAPSGERQLLPACRKGSPGCRRCRRAVPAVVEAHACHAPGASRLQPPRRPRATELRWRLPRGALHRAATANLPTVPPALRFPCCRRPAVRGRSPDARHHGRLRQPRQLHNVSAAPTHLCAQPEKGRLLCCLRHPRQRHKVGGAAAVWCSGWRQGASGRVAAGAVLLCTLRPCLPHLPISIRSSTAPPTPAATTSLPAS